METLRVIEYNVETAAPTSKTRRWAGMQYENNAAEVRFNIGNMFSKDNALYRIDYDSSVAGYHPSENLTINDGVISRRVPLAVTRHGGDVQVTLVVTLRDENGEETGVVYSYPHILYFTAVEKDEEAEKEVTQNMSVIEAKISEAADKAIASAISAEVAASDAETNRILTEDARAALEKGAEFVFLGGDAESSVNVEFVVEDELSPESENPIQNKVAAEALLEINKVVTELKKQNNILSEQNTKLIEQNTALSEQNAQLKKSIDSCLARDYIIEYGSSDIWRYEKWKRGICKLYGLGSYTPNANGNHHITIEYPNTIKFVSAPVILINIVRNQSICSKVIPANLDGNYTSATKLLDVSFCDVQSTGTDPICFAVEVIGMCEQGGEDDGN